MKIKPMDIRKMSVNELVLEFSKGGFGASALSKAVDIFEEMIEEKATIFLGLAGALIPAGLRKVISDLVRDELIHVVVSTGANVTHDLIEAFGGYHFKGVNKKDSDLRKKGIDRIYDVFVEDKSFSIFEENLKKILEDLEEKKYSISEFIHEIGKRIEDENSFVFQASKKNVPIFVPALSDSILGIQIYLFSQDHKIVLDEVHDLKKIFDIAYNSKKTGVIILGGGVPKNFILQTMLITPKSHDYAIQITTATPESGGLSGASLEEAISWGKVSEKSKLVTVYCDATIAFPIVVAAVRERL